MSVRIGIDALTLISETFEPLPGARLLDVGCGAGRLASALLARGAFVIGVDPDERAITAAQGSAPAAEFRVARAESLPFKRGTFDGVIFLNSLHHVPEPAMGPALSEAARVSASTGSVLVVEPLAEGSFFSAFRFVEDETEIRAAAQSAVMDSVARGNLKLERTVEFVRKERFADLDAFLVRVLAADRSRELAVCKHRSEIEAEFVRVSRRDEHGLFVLDQPLRAHVLKPVPVSQNR